MNPEINDKISNTTIQLRVISDPLHWKGVAEAWDVAFSNPMQSYAWLSAWWRHFKFESNAKLAIIAVSYDGKDFAFAPLYVEKTKFGNTVKLLGSGDVCGDYLDIGISQSTDSAACDLAIQQLARFIQADEFTQQFGVIDCVELEGYSDQQTNLSKLIDLIKSDHWASEEVQLEGCWLTEFAETWPKYEAEISKSRRRKVRKALKWIAEGELTWDKTTTKEELADIWPDVVRLHQQRRGMLGQAGCFADPSFQGFLFEAMSNMVDTDRAFVASLREADEANTLIAVVLLLKANNGWQIYQSGADPKAMSRAPGHSLNALILKDAFESNVPSLDFLRGDEPYKEGWFARRIPLKRTRLFGKHLSARIRFHALRAHRQWTMWKSKFRSTNAIGAEK